MRQTVLSSPLSLTVRNRLMQAFYLNDVELDVVEHETKIWIEDMTLRKHTKIQTSI